VLIHFFFHMRERGLKVSLNEWLALMDALARGHGDQNLLGFYHLCRALCVKSERDFDRYDQCFSEYFEGIEAVDEEFDALFERALQWLDLTPEEVRERLLDELGDMDLEELKRLFEERLAEQEEEHNGGSRWIGTGGTSPFGHGGKHPGGVRVGGTGGARSAMQVASKRRFHNLRNDRVLDVRQIGVALRQLRKLTRDGRPDVLDLDETIDETARNAGEIELIFKPERKNSVKLLLLIDVGGSMTPYTLLCERLFSAAHAATHFKAFKHFYFHNCPYETLYENMDSGKGLRTAELLKDLDRTWFCVIVGDAAMHPYELKVAGGAVDYFHDNPEPGIEWLKRIADRFPRNVWLNPEPPKYWQITSTQMIRALFDMYPLTLDGLDEAVTALRSVKL